VGGCYASKGACILQMRWRMCRCGASSNVLSRGSSS
jgi:CDGSH-type Zn-finger protein